VSPLELDAVAADLRRAAEAVAEALAGLADWAAPGDRPGQVAADLVADRAGTEVLHAAGYGVVSEESGRSIGTRPYVVAFDPLDGSTNAIRGTGPYAVSLCAVDVAGPAVAHVTDLVAGRHHTAVRGGGAWRDGEELRVTGCTDLAAAALAVSGHPPVPLTTCTRGWGTAALELCAVATGTFDGFVHCGPDHHGCWDYLGGLLVCLEAGACAEDVRHRNLTTLSPRARRAPLVAATPELGQAIRSRLDWSSPDQRPELSVLG
jgi:fructose-1,6-bisphosphatase/inositol monophosphatase family enzyme